MDILNTKDFIIQALSGGKNVDIIDNNGIPSAMVRIPRFNLSDVITGAPNTPHPMFIVNGVVKDEIYIGKYLGIVKNGRGYSLPNKLPDTGMTYDQALKYCYDKGPGWHLTSNAEYAGLALWCKANGFYPRGNNKYGQSAEKPFERGRCVSPAGVPTTSYNVGQKVTLTSTGVVQTFDPGNAKRIKLEACGGGSTGMLGDYVYGDLDCTTLGSLPIKVYANTTTGDADISIGGTAVANRILYADKGKIGGSANGNKMILSAGFSHTVGLKADGTCVAVGDNTFGQCNVTTWTGIVAISAGAYHTVGLKADGTCVAVGRNMDGTGQCDVSTWTGIVAISAGAYHTVGLKADGTCLAIGLNDDGQCGVSTWTGIVAISAGYLHTVGLKADGTCVSIGRSAEGQCNVSTWANIVAISAGESHTIGLKADGTCVAIGTNTYSQCNVSTWSGITSISAGWYHTLGLKADGTCVAVGNNNKGECNVSSWIGVVSISAGWNYTLCLKADGTCVAVGDNTFGQCNVTTWTNIMKPSGVISSKSNSFVIGNGLCLLTHPNGLVLTNTGLRKGVNNLATSYCAITILELYDNRTYGGTGPVTWTHDNTPDGIYDLNGNVWEWVSGLRLNNGEINIIKDNDAAAQNTDHLSNSTLWKAILQDGSLVVPGTALSLKYDGNANTAGNGKVNTSITLPTSDAVFCNESFYSMVAASGITVPQILKSLALYPIDTTDTCGDVIGWYNHKEFLPFRCGGYTSQQAAGQFCLYLSSSRAMVNSTLGFRVAYYKP